MLYLQMLFSPCTYFISKNVSRPPLFWVSYSNEKNKIKIKIRETNFIQKDEKLYASKLFFFFISFNQGILAVLLRQTNIVWVAWISLERGMDIVEKKSFNKVKKNLINTSSHIFVS